MIATMPQVIRRYYTLTDRHETRPRYDQRPKHACTAGEAPCWSRVKIAQVCLQSSGELRWRATLSRCGGRITYQRTSPYYEPLYEWALSVVAGCPLAEATRNLTNRLCQLTPNYRKARLAAAGRRLHRAQLKLRVKNKALDHRAHEASMRHRRQAKAAAAIAAREAEFNDRKLFPQEVKVWR